MICSYLTNITIFTENLDAQFVKDAHSCLDGPTNVKLESDVTKLKDYDVLVIDSSYHFKNNSSLIIHVVSDPILYKEENLDRYFDPFKQTASQDKMKTQGKIFSRYLLSLLCVLEYPIRNNTILELDL